MYNYKGIRLNKPQSKLLRTGAKVLKKTSLQVLNYLKTKNKFQ